MIRRPEPDTDNFYISWGDLVTLLLVFFVYLFSISEIDPIKFIEAKNSMQEEITQTKDNAIEKIQMSRKKLKEIKQEIDNYILDE